jgi:acetolactate synthase-1/2/3 large subunit
VPDPAACTIQVDIDPAEIGRSVVPRIGIVGDIRIVLQDLIASGCRSQHQSERRTRLEAIERDKRQLQSEASRMAASGQRPLHPLRVLSEVRAAFPRETTVAVDVGVLAQGMGGAFPYFPVCEPRSLIVPSSFYGMGFSASALPVAKLVHADRPSVGFVGDGSFQMVMNVLPTAAECRLPVRWCVLNDQALGSIWDGQQARYGNRIIATTFAVQPDFAAIARACECYGEKIEDAADIRPALERALLANGQGTPAVLDFIVARERVSGSVEFFAKS